MISQLYELYIDSDEFYNIYQCEFRKPIIDENHEQEFEI